MEVVALATQVPRGLSFQESKSLMRYIGIWMKTEKNFIYKCMYISTDFRPVYGCMLIIYADCHCQEPLHKCVYNCKCLYETKQFFDSPVSFLWTIVQGPRRSDKFTYTCFC